MDEIVTSDMAKFGHRERAMAAELLNAMTQQGLPDDFEDDGVTVAMNMHSGYVFLTNSEYEVAMMNGDKLESFYSCPECGSEGFADEIHDGDKLDELPSGCADFLRSICGWEDEEVA